MREDVPYRTSTGRILTDADIERLALEAERGYDVGFLAGRPSRRRGRVATMLSKDEILDTLEKMSLRELVDLAKGFRERVLGEHDEDPDLGKAEDEPGPWDVST